MNCKAIQCCRICGNTDLIDALSFGEQYLASTFVTSNTENSPSHTRYPLTAVLCNKESSANACGLLQLKETIDRNLLYREYFYRSAVNPMMREALKEITQETLQRTVVRDGDAVLDIGCNDGIMLTYYPPTLRRIGIDPAENIRINNPDPSIRIHTGYFSAPLALHLNDNRLYKIITSIAMFYDLDDPGVFVRDVKSILAPDGIWCIQLSYLGDVIRNMNFYDFCHEHLCYYSLRTLSRLLETNGLKITDVQTNDVNGGSLRVFIAHASANISIHPDVENKLQHEDTLKLDCIETYHSFAAKISKLKQALGTYLAEEKKNGGLIIGLGASTKGNVLLQFFGIGKSLLPYISDRNPEKAGLRTLGTDIEIIPEDQAHALNPSCSLVLIWFFKEEIIRREHAYLAQGGKLLFPMPYIHIITKDGEQFI